MNNALSFIRTIIYKYHLYIAIIILSIMFALSFFTMKNDSAIMDEVAHIPAGYSYLKYADYRLNPEHPPLLKDISAAPLLLLDLKFPENIPAWTDDVNGQWEAGWHFLYHDGNNADKILFYARLPILFLAVIFGFSIYLFCLKRFGPTVSLLALALFAFSPSILAHNHFVTTDLGIAMATFFAIWSLINWLDNPASKKYFFIAVIFFAIAQITKFSAIMLVPFFIGMTIIKIISRYEDKNIKKEILRYGIGLMGIFTLGIVLVWLFYVPHTLNMTAEMQDKLIKGSLAAGYFDLYGNILTSANNFGPLKPLVQYLLGILMVVDRVQSGNITYFLGEATDQSYLLYFPASFILKTPLPMIIIIITTFIAAVIAYFKNTPLKLWHNFRAYSKNHFTELTFILFIIFYSYLSISGNLNLGIRHLFPIMPFVFILTAKEVLAIYHKIKRQKLRLTFAITLILLMAWYIVIAIVQFPKYVPYTDALYGGSANASKYFSDSNVDWGQDAKRLYEYVNDNPDIGEKIAVDYFGGADPRYYFCKRAYDSSGELIKNASGYDCSDSKFIAWHVEDGIPPTKYIAISETFLMNDIYYSNDESRKFDYKWLRDKEPVAKVGDSIYIYLVN